MNTEICDTIMFLRLTKYIWDAIEQTYSEAKTAAQVYTVKVKIVAQNRVYDATVMKEFIEQESAYDFIVELNPEFDQIRIQVLCKINVPSFDEVVAIIGGK